MVDSGENETQEVQDIEGITGNEVKCGSKQLNERALGKREHHHIMTPVTRRCYLERPEAEQSPPASPLGARTSESDSMPSSSSSVSLRASFST